MERSDGPGGVVRGERPGAGVWGGSEVDVEVMFAELIVGAGTAVTERLRAEHGRYIEHTGRLGPRQISLREVEIPPHISVTNIIVLACE